MSTFASHQTEFLLQKTLSVSRPSSPRLEDHVSSSARTQQLHSLLASFKLPIRPSLIQETINVLEEDWVGTATDFDLDAEEGTLRQTAIGAVAASIYGQILDMLLQQATEADVEANWWAEVERSRRNLAWYLLETLPLRLKRVFLTIIYTLRAKNLAITPRAFTPNSLRRLFPTSSRPSQLAISFFPHLSRHTRLILRSPFELIRQECSSNRRALQDLRNDLAERLGSLSTCRTAVLSDPHELSIFVGNLRRVIDNSGNMADDQNHTLIASLSDINSSKLPQSFHLYEMGISALRRPSRLTRMWPRLFVIPPVTFVIFRFLYGSRTNFVEHLTQAIETAAGFWKNYLVQPVRDVLDTVRTGGEEGPRIISQEGVRADMESLERMVLALSKDKYNFSSTELEGLSMQIRQGDLTPVLKVYEEDLKSPLKSAIAGSLIRSLLIQVQKMKVDVDVALSGIDKLLKSQELTFAFVGVAPALAIVYAMVGWIRSLWQSGQGKGRYGGRGRRRSVWLSIRRIERLLVLSSNTPSAQASDPKSLAALDQGLILLSVAQLRSYAERYLPARSRLREEFLIDVADLEDPGLGRAEKMDVVSRMWRSWGVVLGWVSIEK